MDEEYLKEMLMKKYNELTEKRSLKSRIKGFTDAAARAWQSLVPEYIPGRGRYTRGAARAARGVD